jgi:hypothetical protein
MTALVLYSSPSRDPKELASLAALVKTAFTKAAGTDPSSSEVQMLTALCNLTRETSASAVASRVGMVVGDDIFVTALVTGDTIPFARALQKQVTTVRRLTVGSQTSDVPIADEKNLGFVLFREAQDIAQVTGQHLDVIDSVASGGAAPASAGLPQGTSLREFTAGDAAAGAGVVAVGTVGVVAVIASFLVPIAIVGGIGYWAWNKHKENEGK